MTILIQPEAKGTCEAYNALQEPASNTIMTIEESRVYTSRHINNKLVRLVVSLDGTTQDLIAKCDRVSNLTDTMYKMLSEISMNCEASDELV